MTAQGFPQDFPRFAVVDVETSGLSTRRHRLLQVAVVELAPVDGQLVVTGEWSSLVGARWPWQRVGPRQIHGISRGMLKTAPPLREVMHDFASLVDGSVVVAHNFDFDWAFLRRAARRTGTSLDFNGELCTLRLSRRLDADRQLSHRLADVLERYGLSNASPHNALADAHATAALLPKLLTDAGLTTTTAITAAVGGGGCQPAS